MNLLHKLLCLETEEVFKAVYSELTALYSNDSIEYDGENFMVLHGDNPIALVAHIDTVRRSGKPVSLKIKGNVIRNTDDILGADCRAGVYGIITAAKKCRKHNVPLPTLIFTNLEEVGGIGVKQLLQAKVLKTDNIKLFVEMDRQGCNDYVFYSWTLPKAVKKYVKQWGYVEGHGSYSDISDLTNEYAIPSVNVSCGYYSQHTKEERLHVDELEMNINRVVQMLKQPIQELHKVEERSREVYDWEEYYQSRYGYNYGKYNKGRSCSDYYKATTKTDSYEKKYYDYDTDTQDLTELDSKMIAYDGGVPVEGAADDVGMDGIMSLKDLRIQIRMELVCDGELSASLDMADPYYHDVMYEIEDTFAYFMKNDPTDPENTFDYVWEDTVDNWGVTNYKYV